MSCRSPLKSSKTYLCNEPSSPMLRNNEKCLVMTVIRRGRNRREELRNIQQGRRSLDVTSFLALFTLARGQRVAMMPSTTELDAQIAALIAQRTAAAEEERHAAEVEAQRKSRILAKGSPSPSEPPVCAFLEARLTTRAQRKGQTCSFTPAKARQARRKLAQTAGCSSETSRECVRRSS